MWNARLRLGCLWISHFTRVMADNCLRIYVALDFARLGTGREQGAWHLVTLLLVLPAVFLAPINGSICNGLPKRRVLMMSSFYALAAVAGFALGNAQGNALILCWSLVALTAAVNGPVRYAFLPAASQDVHWPLTRINGIFEMGSAVAIVAGLEFGASPGLMVFGASQPTLKFVTLLLAVAFAASFFVRFPSDMRRKEPPLQAIASFFTDCARIWSIPETRGCLFGLASLRGLMTGLMGALIAASLNGSFSINELLIVGGWVLGGVAAGSFLAGLQRHPRRVLGLVPWGTSGLTLGLVGAACGMVPGPALCILLGVMVGLINVPLAATYQGALPPDARGNGMAVRNFADYLLAALMAGLLFALANWAGWSASAQLWLIAALTGALALLSWRLLIGPVFELFLEFVIWPIYRIKGFGPGIEAIPPRGPVLVIANHTAWMDPVWAGKVLPRRLIGMLTSAFFDIPALRFVVTHLAETIRVEQSTFRREVPEIQKAISILDRGDCVLIFPEGGLRKKEENLLKQFGQGVWHILSERPQTPVVVCWIEGGWGCYFSYFNGRPTQNKRFDFWRKIRIAVNEPVVLPAEVLADQRATRRYLMDRCLETRRILGLDVPAPEKMPIEEDTPV